MSDSPIHVEVDVRKGPGTTIEEFIAAVREAAVGLDDAYIDAHEFYETNRIAVCGWRKRTEEECAEYERHERLLWLAAKGTYERGLSKFGGES